MRARHQLTVAVGGRWAVTVVVAAVVVIGLMMPATARSNMTLSLANGVMEITGDDGVDLLNVTNLANGFARVDLGFNSTVLTPATCSAPDTFGVTECESPTQVVANLGGGDDQVQFMDYPLTVDLGPGDDHAISGAAGDAITGGPGRDEVDYSDTVVGNARRGGPVTVTVNGIADDGEANEGDNISSTVEVIDGTGLGDHLVGDDGAQELNGAGGNDVLEGGGGDDLIAGSEGDDTIDGGPGNDDLRGNVDSDNITGGPGRDKVHADDACTIFTCGFGADQVFVRDGEVDDVDCGVGPDAAVADRQDLLVGCDTVDLPPIAPGSTPVPPPGTTPPHAPVPSPSTGGAVQVSGGRGRVRFVLDHQWLVAGRLTTVVKLVVIVPARTRVDVRCVGRSCPFRNWSKKGERRINAKPMFRGKRLRVGTRIEIRVTKPGVNGSVLTFTTRARAIPKVSERCLRPGSSRPTRHC